MQNNTLEKSKYGLRIRQDNKAVQVFTSSFEKRLGEIFTIDGIKYKVCALEQSETAAIRFLNVFGREWVFSFFDFNSVDGRKAL